MGMARAVGFEPTIPDLETGALDQAKLRPYWCRQVSLFRNWFLGQKSPGSSAKRHDPMTHPSPPNQRTFDQLFRDDEWEGCRSLGEGAESPSFRNDSALKAGRGIGQAAARGE